MKTNLHERTLRILLSALLQSNLSVSELKRLSHDLVENPKFLWEFGELLDRITAQMQSSKDFSNTIESVDEHLIEDVYARLKEKRISRKKLYDYMELINPSIAKRHIDPTDPVRDMLERFFYSAAPYDIEMLINIIHENSMEDPYLKGITLRR